jgi:hypothetical protein
MVFAVTYSKNINKCFQIKFSRSKHPINFTYMINNITLNSVDHVKDLGLTNSNRFSVITNIIDIHCHCKAMRMLGFVFRNASRYNNPVCWKVLCYAFVRLILEYGSIIWNPCQSTLINKIDNVQNNFFCKFYNKFNIIKFNLIIYLSRTLYLI